VTGNNSLGEAVLDLAADMNGLVDDINKSKPKALSALDSLGKAGGLLLAAGITVAATAIVGITSMMWDAGQTLDAAYDKIQSQTGATGAELEALKADFDDVFTSVPASADDAASAISGLNQRLGLTGPVLQDTAERLLEMTRLTGGDLSANIEQFTRFIGDAGISSEDAASALDTLFVASQQTGTGVDRLMQLAVQFGAPMRQFGFSWEESIAMLGKWEKEGVNTELVMGSLRIAAGKFADANVPLRQGLEDTFEKIKNAKDGSEALSIAMDVFGARAGPDMAAAIRENRFELGDLVGTLQNADGAIMDTAESTMDWGERWTLFKNRITDALGPSGMGLMESVNAVLGTLEDTLARPDVQKGIMAIVNGIVWMAQTGAAYLPILIDNIFKFVDYLKNNEGIVVAILAALGTAIVAFAITSAPAIWGVLSPILAVVAIMAVVAAVAYLLYEAWTNNWGGIQDKVMAVWAVLQPMLQNLWNWLSTNIPAALQALSGFWTGTLLPAIMSVWLWLNGTLFPFFMAMGNFLGAVFSVAITALAGIWQNVLQPALAAVFGVLSSQLMPAFKTLADFWTNTLQPIVQAIAQWIGGSVVGAFKGLTSTLQTVTTWLNTIATKLNAMKLPDWMTPGSPTPWEIGLLGVNDALRQVSNIGLPRLNASMVGMGAPALASGMTNGSGQAISIGDIYVDARGAKDPKAVGQAAGDEVLKKIRSMGGG
jgi:TP901 family phage tail tape measure protein